MSDRESAAVLVHDAAYKLKELDPDHELLKYFFAFPEDLVDGKLDPSKEEEIQDQKYDRFWNKEGDWREKPGSIVATVVDASYFVALKKEIERITAKAY